MQIVLVAAIGENNVIGRAGQLPWRLKSDLQHFRALTMNRPLIMGRKTFESIGKPLKGRTNIVLTRDLGLNAPGTVLATSCLLYTSDAADEEDSVDLGGRRIIKK